MSADGETRAADVADIPALLDFLPQSHRDLRHVGVDLHKAIAVGDLNPDPEVIRRTDGSNASTGSSDDRRAVGGQQIDAGVEVRITAEGRFYRERGQIGRASCRERV